MKTADWYFDFISPYGYLQAARLDEAVQRGPACYAGLVGSGTRRLRARIGWTAPSMTRARSVSNSVIVLTRSR